MSFYSNFLKLCVSVGKSPSRVVLDIGLKKPAVTRWKAGGNPTDATLSKIADYFGVSVDELKGVEEQKKTVTIDSDGLDELDIQFVSLLKQLSAQEKQMLVAQMEALIRLRGQ